MLIPATASAQNIEASREKISQTLSIDEDEAKIKEEERRQQHIQKLVPEIKEPIIL